MNNEIISIEWLGTLIGILLIYLLFRAGKNLGGAVGAALKSLTLGVLLFTAAFLASAILDTFDLVPMVTSMILHMVLMAVAMIMIVLSALKFIELTKTG